MHAKNFPSIQDQLHTDSLNLLHIRVLAVHEPVRRLLLALHFEQQPPDRRQERNKHRDTLLICGVSLGILGCRDALREDGRREEKRTDYDTGQQRPDRSDASEWQLGKAGLFGRDQWEEVDNDLFQARSP